MDLTNLLAQNELINRCGGRNETEEVEEGSAEPMEINY